MSCREFLKLHLPSLTASGDKVITTFWIQESYTNSSWVVFPANFSKYLFPKSLQSSNSSIKSIISQFLTRFIGNFSSYIVQSSGDKVVPKFWTRESCTNLFWVVFPTNFSKYLFSKLLQPSNSSTWSWRIARFIRNISSYIVTSLGDKVVPKFWTRESCSNSSWVVFLLISQNICFSSHCSLQILQLEAQFHNFSHVLLGIS